MDNTTYEFFICRCWKSKRFQHGANTDTWEDLLIKHYHFVNAMEYNKIKLEKEYKTKLKTIKGYLDKAYENLSKRIFKLKIEENVSTELRNNQILVRNSNNPQEIFDILNKSFEIMNSKNL